MSFRPSLFGLLFCLITSLTSGMGMGYYSCNNASVATVVNQTCTIDCVTGDMCSNTTVSCASTIPIDKCIILCNGTGVCNSATFSISNLDRFVLNGGSASGGAISSLMNVDLDIDSVDDVSITCVGTSVCVDLSASVTSGQDVSLHCKGPSVCTSSLFDFADMRMADIIINDTANTEFKSSILCPTVEDWTSEEKVELIDGDRPCQIHCGTGSCSNIDIQAVLGFSDVFMTCDQVNHTCFGNNTVICESDDLDNVWTVGCEVEWVDGIGFTCDDEDCQEERFTPSPRTTEEGKNNGRELDFEDVATMRFVAGGLFVILFSLLCGLAYLKYKDKHVSFGIDRWGVTFMCFSTFASILIVLIAFTSAVDWKKTAGVSNDDSGTTPAPTTAEEVVKKRDIDYTQPTQLELLFGLLLAVNYCIFVTIIAVAMHEEYNMTWARCCSSRALSKRAQKDREKGGASRAKCFKGRDSRMFWWGLLAVVATAVLFYLHAYWFQNLWYLPYCSLIVIVPYVMECIWIMLLSKFLVIVLAYIAFMGFVLFYQDRNGTDVIFVVFWAEFFYIIMPLLGMFFFTPKASVRRMGMTIVVVALSVMDLLTDANVVYVWIVGGEYVWAGIQTAIIIAAQGLAAIWVKDIKERREKTEKAEDGTTMTVEEIVDRNKCHHQCMIFVGIGRVFYGIKSFKNLAEEDDDAQRLEFNLLKVWEMIYEQFPTFVLQYYVILRSNNEFSTSIYASIGAGAMMISFTMLKTVFSQALPKGFKTKKKKKKKKKKRKKTQEDLATSEPGEGAKVTEKKTAFNVEPGSPMASPGSRSPYAEPGSPGFSPGGPEDFPPGSNLQMARLSLDSNTSVESTGSTPGEDEEVEVVEIKYTYIFYVFLWIFTLTDVYVRITPPLVLTIIYFNWLGESYGALLIMAASAVGFSIYEILMYRFVMLKKPVRQKWKRAFKYFPIGVISSCYYMLRTIGLKIGLPSTIAFRTGLVREHLGRVLISLLLFGVIAKNQYDHGFSYQGTSFLFGVGVVLNLVTLGLLHIELGDDKDVSL